MFSYMSNGKTMKLLVSTPCCWLKRLHGINNTITQIQEKTTNATQDQIEF